MTPEQRKLRDFAADMLETFGWTQGQYTDCNGKMCLQGVLMFARRSHPSLPRSMPIPFYYPKAVEWNDAPGRTKEEVIALLRSDAEEV